MKIFCIGRNYVDHAKELNNPIPKKPLIFMKPATALLRNNKPFYYPNFTKDLHYEVEIVLKICKNGKSIAKKKAHNYYQELSLGIDFTARDIQRECKEKGHPWERAKSFDSSACVGKFISKDSLDLNNLNFELHLNKIKVQKGNSKDMIFNFDTLISDISQIFTIQRGDLIYTGTPAGVGPCKIGDEMIGVLEDYELFNMEIK